MDKTSFVTSFQYMDKLILTNIFEKLIIAEKTGKTIFTSEFYPPVIWNKLSDLKEEFEVGIFSYGIFPESERRIIAFSTIEPREYPIELIKITALSHFDSLEHRDFLGAIMALGIKREKFGDIVLYQNACYLALDRNLYDFLLNNLVSIGKSPCIIEKLDIHNEYIPAPVFQEKIILSTSYRLDCIISGICDVSRNEASELINRGKVLINYYEACDKSLKVPESSVITVRGYGKYKVLKELGITSKGRYRIEIKKYI